MAGNVYVVGYENPPDWFVWLASDTDRLLPRGVADDAPIIAVDVKIKGRYIRAHKADRIFYDNGALTFYSSTEVVS